MSIFKKIVKKRNLKLFIKKLFLIYKRLPSINHKKWFEIDGDNTLRVNYNLNSESVFVEVGGYKGFYSKKIYDKFKPKTYIFEPDINFVKDLKLLFEKNVDVKIIDKALGNKTGDVYLVEKGDSSFVENIKNESHSSQKVRMVSFDEFLKTEDIETIDLISINIEGGEYQLIEHIINNNLITKIINLQIQFHKNVKNHSKLKASISKQLSETHNIEWSYNYVWESWKLKDTFSK